MEVAGRPRGGALEIVLVAKSEQVELRALAGRVFHLRVDLQPNHKNKIKMQLKNKIKNNNCKFRV
jgi:hypothetical protein